MLTIENFKKWKDHLNYNFYTEIGEYFSKFNDIDKRHNRIYFKLKVEPSEKISIPQEIIDYLNWHRCYVLDSKKGLCSYGSKIIRIGKYLNDYNKDLLKKYSESRTALKNPDNLSVVICRHPYDIIGMSTGRGWSTCIDLNDTKYGGKHLYCLKNKMESGCFNDRNINNPVSRIAIYKDYYSGLYLDKCYGAKVEEFINFVNNWVDGYNKMKNK
jgi:hypothetical protein